MKSRHVLAVDRPRYVRPGWFLQVGFRSVQDGFFSACLLMIVIRVGTERKRSVGGAKAGRTWGEGAWKRIVGGRGGHQAGRIGAQAGRKRNVGWAQATVRGV